MPMTNEEIEVLKNSCIERWSDSATQSNKLDKKLQKVSEIFEEWFQQIPEYSQITVKALLEHLKYYSRDCVSRHLEAFHNRLISTYNISDKKTIYTCIKSKYGNLNSSTMYTGHYLLINNIDNHVSSQDISTAINHDSWKNKENIVFIDDCSGTGNSVVEQLQKNEGEYSGKTVYLIVINIMDSAIANITNYTDKHNIKFVYISLDPEKKVFEKDIFKDNNVAKTIIEEMSNELKICSLETLGYKDSQNLIAFYNNTPNNTLGFIRCNVRDIYSSIFPRNGSKAGDYALFNKDKKLRNTSNYINKLSKYQNA